MVAWGLGLVFELGACRLRALMFLPSQAWKHGLGFVGGYCLRALMFLPAQAWKHGGMGAWFWLRVRVCCLRALLFLPSQAWKYGGTGGVVFGSELT